MTRIDPSQVKLINKFQTWNDHFILLSDGTFYVFGEGKEAYKRCLVVEGRIDLHGDHFNFATYKFPVSLDGELEEIDTKFDPGRKISFFNEKTNGVYVASFSLSANKIKEIKNNTRGTPTHIRFLQRNSNELTIRSFDARTYYKGFIVSKSINDFQDHSIQNQYDNDFQFFMRWDAFKSLPTDDWVITIYDNELMILEAHKTGYVVYTRDQRLGSNLEKRLGDINTYHQLMLMDPSKQVPTKNNWDNPSLKRLRH